MLKLPIRVRANLLSRPSHQQRRPHGRTRIKDRPESALALDSLCWVLVVKSRSRLPADQTCEADSTHLATVVASTRTGLATPPISASDRWKHITTGTHSPVGFI